MVVFEATILGEPITKKNSPQIFVNKRTGRRFIVPSNAQLVWSRSAALQLRATRPAAAGFGCPMNLTARFYRSVRRGDLGNFLAAVCDALEQADIVTNDKWIMGFDGSRLDHDPTNPRVELTLSLLEDLPCRPIT